MIWCSLNLPYPDLMSRSATVLQLPPYQSILARHFSSLYYFVHYSCLITVNYQVLQEVTEASNTPATTVNHSTPASPGATAHLLQHGSCKCLLNLPWFLLLLRCRVLYSVARGYLAHLGWLSENHNFEDSSSPSRDVCVSPNTLLCTARDCPPIR